MRSARDPEQADAAPGASRRFVRERMHEPSSTSAAEAAPQGVQRWCPTNANRGRPWTRARISPQRASLARSRSGTRHRVRQWRTGRYPRPRRRRLRDLVAERHAQPTRPSRVAMVLASCAKRRSRGRVRRAARARATGRRTSLHARQRFWYAGVLRSRCSPAGRVLDVESERRHRPPTRSSRSSTVPPKARKAARTAALRRVPGARPAQESPARGLGRRSPLLRHHLAATARRSPLGRSPRRAPRLSRRASNESRTSMRRFEPSIPGAPLAAGSRL
jgi:hypothetical protein